MTTSVESNFMPTPASLISNLQQVLALKSDNAEQHASSSSRTSSLPSKDKEESAKPVALVTNAEGIESPGLTFLVQALLLHAQFDVFVCAPKSDRSMTGHSVTVGETISVSSAQINGATGFEVFGTPADCVSLALSGALFSNWSKPSLVVSGIHKGLSSGNNMFYSGAVAGAREALICGVPSLCISLNWKKGVSCESDMKDAATVYLPLIYAAVKGIQEGVFPKSCLLNVEIPSRPLTNKGAARRTNSQHKHVEIESVGAARNMSSQKTVKCFRLEFLEEQQENVDADQDIRALQDGFVSVTPISISPTFQSEIQTSVSNWMAGAI